MGGVTSTGNLDGPKIAKVWEVELDKDKQPKMPEGDVTLHLNWEGDHPDWKGKEKDSEKALEPRSLPKYYRGNGLANLNVGQSKETVKIEVAWNWKDGKLITNDLEIYAVIRAEFRFIAENGWKKIKAKTKVQGMDSLFIKGSGLSTEYAIVESKCTTYEADYEAWLDSKNVKLVSEKKPGAKTPEQKLGSIKRPKELDQQLLDFKIDDVRQMSKPWIYEAIDRETRRGQKPKVDGESLDVLRTLQGMMKWMGEGNMPYRFLNVYGTDPIYLLPGFWSLWVRKGTNILKGGKKQVGFSSKPYEPMEFYALDEDTEKKEPIGLAQSLVKQFKEMLGVKGIDDNKKANEDMRIKVTNKLNQTVQKLEQKLYVDVNTV